MEHRDTIQLNCRNFVCVNNEKGKCILEKITLTPIGNLIRQVICVESEEEKNDS